jgi:hypothetical protein
MIFLHHCPKHLFLLTNSLPAMWFSTRVTLFTAAASLFFTGSNTTIVNRADAKAVFTSARWSPNTTIAFPGQANFNAKTERWSIFDPPTYFAVVSPATEADLVQTVCRQTRQKYIKRMNESAKRFDLG